MKKLDVSISVIKENKNFTQVYAGGLPIESDQAGCFTIDSDDGDSKREEHELLIKFLVNVMAVFYKATSKSQEDFINKIAKLPKVRDEFLAKINAA